MRRLHVWLRGVHVADLVEQVSGHMTLAYRPGAASLSLSLPAEQLEHGDATVRPWLANLLPDDDRVLVRWARRLQVSATPFGLLGSEAGLDCAGAVQFTEDGHDLPGSRESGVRWLDDSEQRALADDLHDDRTGWGERLTGGRFSLAGAQTKVALHVDGDRVGVPFGDTPSNVIVKPSIDGFADHEVNEHLCLAAAGRCGLDVATTRLWEVGDRRLLMVARFDRAVVAGEIRREHQEDVCQALGVSHTRRYQNEGGPGPREVAGLLQSVQRPSIAQHDLQRFVEALLLNWLLAGTDAHAKNYSLMLPEQGPVRLAPLYDVASIAPYEDVRGAKLSMKLGGSYRLKAVTLGANVPKLASEVGVDADWAVARARALGAELPDAIRDAAAASEIAETGPAANLVDSVAQHIGRCLL